MRYYSKGTTGAECPERAILEFRDGEVGAGIEGKARLRSIGSKGVLYGAMLEKLGTLRRRSSLP